MSDAVLIVRLLQGLADYEKQLGYGDVATIQAYDRTAAPNGTIKISGSSWEQIDAALKSFLREGLVHSGTLRDGELPVGIMFAGLTEKGRNHLQALLTARADGFGVADTGDAEFGEQRNAIRLIDTVIDQQNSWGRPVMVLHLTSDDWLAVRAFKARFPHVAPAHGEPTSGDPRPRYRLIPIARSARDFSFAELGPQIVDGRLYASWIPIDSPSISAGGAPFGPSGHAPMSAVVTQGIARIRHADTGEIYEIMPSELDWQEVGSDEREMGAEITYAAEVDHPELGILKWELWQYPMGMENDREVDVGKHTVLENFSISLGGGSPDEPDGDELDWRNFARRSMHS